MFGLWTLLVLAKPLEEKVGPRRFGNLALAGVLGGALGASCLQLLGASGGAAGGAGSLEGVRRRANSATLLS